MPGFDGTGPLGGGPGTGRGFGNCAPVRPAAYGYRRGYFGRGFGRGAGWASCRWWAGAPGPYYGRVRQDPVDEKAFLRDQAESLRAELAELEQRMADLEQSAE